MPLLSLLHVQQLIKLKHRYTHCIYSAQSIFFTVFSEIFAGG